ncbi:MAG: FAD-dependent oxidoreductase, partial [Alphaproteobacteria bacterium]
MRARPASGRIRLPPGPRMAEGAAPGARGGTGALVRALVALFERLGGTIRLNTPVDEIVTRDGRVVA